MASKNKKYLDSLKTFCNFWSYFESFFLFSLKCLAKQKKIEYPSSRSTVWPNSWRHLLRIKSPWPFKRWTTTLNPLLRSHWIAETWNVISPLCHVAKWNNFATLPNIFFKTKQAILRTAMAQWIRLRLRYCSPGFESQAHHLCFFQFIF